VDEKMLHRSCFQGRNCELNKLISLSLRDLLHLKFHIQFKPSHIPILAIEEALSCERLKVLGIALPT